MNGANKSTRMPDVSLKPETIDEKVKEATPIPEGKMFKKKKANLSLEVKEIDNPNYVAKVLDTIVEDEPVQEVAQAKQTKVKKKLTDKQLEALKRGREKSIATRRARKEALELEKQNKKQAKAQLNAEKHQELDSMSSHATDYTEPVQRQPIGGRAPTGGRSPLGQPSQKSHGGIAPSQSERSMWGAELDYDKIINGLADEQDKRQQARANREHQVAEDIKKYEDQIRQDERQRILAEVEEEEHKEQMKHNQQKTHSIFNPQIPVNAYSRNSYGSFGSRSRRNF